MSNFISLADSAISQNNMLNKGDKVIVALSGGADSVSLLNVLLSLKDKYSLTVMAAHVNHNIRGEEALRDESFVKKLCEDNNVELFIKSVDVNKLAKAQKISTELCGRNVRYEFFKELHNKYNCKIATAHTASDNAETLIFNLVRGSGLQGMCGIVPKRDYIIRPLIYITREQVENYCKDNNLSFVTDSTNLTTDYTRNKIRHNIIPLLKEINPSFDITAVKNSRSFIEINDCIHDLADDAIAKAKSDNGYNAEYINTLNNAVKKTALLKIVKKAGGKPENCHIESLVHCIEKGGCVDIPDNVRAICKQGVLRFTKSRTVKDKFPVQEFSANMNFNFNGNNYSVLELKNHNHKELLSYDILKKSPVVRTRRQKDTFTLPYRNVTKSLKKLLNELKIPQEKRDSLVLISDGSTVLWCEEVGVSKQGMSDEDCGYKIVVENLI